MPDTSAVKRALISVRDSTRSATAKTRATTEAHTKKGLSYRPLPKAFRRDGFSYLQIARQGDAAIYEQTWNRCRNPSISYEVIRIRRRQGFQIGGRFVEPAEIYPNSEAWGTDGFTLTDKHRAFVKFSDLLRQMQHFPAKRGTKQ